MNCMDCWLVLGTKKLKSWEETGNGALSLSVVCVLQRSQSQTAQTDQATCRYIGRYIDTYM